MDVTEAVQRRMSTRAFLDSPVDDATIAELLGEWATFVRRTCDGSPRDGSSGLRYRR